MGTKGRGEITQMFCSADKEYADKLNSFYCRFDCNDFSKERERKVEGRVEGEG